MSLQAETGHPAEVDHAEIQVEALHTDTGTEVPHHTHMRFVILHSQLQNPAKLPAVTQLIISQIL